ncbi:hypothetical protein EFQ32_00805 [Limosilactobacillus fermentum]|nr:hypothetical protein [Limosilactobacillus fermentum]
MEPTLKDVKASFEETGEKQGERFFIENEGQLEWAFRKIQEVQDDNENQDKILEATKEYVDRHKKDNQKIIEYMRGLIAEYAELKKSEEPDYEYKGVLGRLTWTKPKQTIVKTSDEELIKQFKGTKLVEKEEKIKLKWGDLKRDLVITPDGKVITSNGEVVSGVAVKDHPSTLAIKKRTGKSSWKEIK